MASEGGLQAPASEDGSQVTEKMPAENGQLTEVQLLEAEIPPKPDDVPGAGAVNTLSVLAFAQFLSRTLLISVVPYLILAKVSGQDPNSFSDSHESCSSSSTGDAARWSTLITSGTNLAMFLTAPALGAASDALGRKPLLILALVVLLADVIALITFPSLGVIAAAAILGGAFNGSTAAITAAFADLSFIQRHSFTNNFGLFYAAFGLALIVGPGAGGLLAKTDLRIPCGISIGLVVGLIGYVTMIWKETLSKSLRRPMTCIQATSLPALRVFCTNKNLMLLALPYILAQFGSGYIYILAYYFCSRYEWTALKFGLWASAVGVSLVLTQALVIRRVVPAVFNEQRAVLVFFSLNGIVVLLQGVAPLAWMQFVFFPFLGLATIAETSLRSIITKLTHPDEQGALQGSLQALHTLCTAVGAPVYGLLFRTYVPKDSSTHVPGAPFYLSSALFFAAVLAAWFAFGKVSAMRSFPSESTPDL